ncbi:transcriptional regulator, TetR family [Paraglaciecola sp. T6c]|uniref:TetR/AcrR family transcriptional regulator n=1 Tax=Pseudoalteromonas atlantica (strain T6c / ATCC BAA-1087) TaxID=3042615 RepID=UPI00005C6569|nr:TetR/AcrR family transcriptional regulator [Paraglaciecola sp. T6c]ABG39814.1 transcriptional regulator, TetR family [Paraglaciecola sp. T6c]
MPTPSVIPAKQIRSQDTQRKLMAAVHHCLQSKFFEHISIKELCDHAGVSVGTFYRRFKNKEALLPLLYQDFGRELTQWIEQLEQMPFETLAEAVKEITRKTHDFFIANRSLFRTIHLNSRLHTHIVAGEALIDRQVMYKRMSQILLRFSDDINAADRSSVANMVIFTMITALLDKVLYPDITPSIACELDSVALCDELTKMLLLYLGHSNV